LFELVELLVPAPLPLRGHQPIPWVHLVVLLEGALRFVLELLHLARASLASLVILAAEPDSRVLGKEKVLARLRQRRILAAQEAKHNSDNVRSRC